MEPKVKEPEKRTDGVAQLTRPVEQKAKAATDEAAAWVRAHRLPAVTGAFVVGVLLGVLLRR